MKKKLNILKTLRKNAGNTSNFILTIICIIAIIFTVAMIVIFCIFQSVPDSLIAAVFGFISVEGGVLGGIKITKTKHSKEEDTAG